MFPLLPHLQDFGPGIASQRPMLWLPVGDGRQRHSLLNGNLTLSPQDVAGMLGNSFTVELCGSNI